jgi:hypothetical protein
MAMNWWKAPKFQRVGVSNVGHLIGGPGIACPAFSAVTGLDLGLEG